MTKILAFEYLVDQFILWGKEAGIERVETDFTKLKLIKLLFFAAAVNSDEKDPGLLSIFDKFYAMPLGHVESDVYDNLKDCQRYSISRNGFTYLEGKAAIDFSPINEHLPKLGHAVCSLKDTNNDLIKYSASQLVDLSHRWYSWRTTFSLARSVNKFSERIDTKLIQKEKKYFH